MEAFSAALPFGTYSLRATTAVACAAPFVADDIVISAGAYPLGQVMFLAPSLGMPSSGPEDADGGEGDGRPADAGPSFPLSLDIPAGPVQVLLPDGGRLLGPRCCR